jgi:TPR repeat protein
MLRFIVVILVGLGVVSPVAAQGADASRPVASDAAPAPQAGGGEVILKVRVAPSDTRRSSSVGAKIKMLPEKYAHIFGLPRQNWVVTIQVEARGGGRAAGLLPGDIYLRVNGRTASSTYGFIEIISAQEAGSEVELVVWRCDMDAVRTGLGSLADAGDVEAALWLGTLFKRYERNSDNTKAIHWYRKAADAGNVKGMLDLAWFYRYGVGVGEDHQEADAWTKKAADAGDLPARLELLSRANDFAAVAATRRELAERGDPHQMYELAKLYENGRGLQRDAGQAFSWYRKAAKAGHVAAAYNVGIAYDSGRGVKRSVRLAMDWYQRAAEGGNIVAMQNLAELYGTGMGVQMDHAKAAAWRAEILATDVSTGGLEIVTGQEDFSLAGKDARVKRLQVAGIFRGSADPKPKHKPK